MRFEDDEVRQKSIEQGVMRFSLRSLLYGTTHACLALAAFGIWGILLSAVVIALWIYILSQTDRPTALGRVVLGLILCGCGAGLFFGTVSVSSIEFSRRTQCQGNLKGIAMGMEMYHSRYNAYPPAYVPDANGEPMHSWRVLLLPFLDCKALYEQYNFSEPWNGPNNSALIPQIPSIYHCPSSDRLAGQTDYFIVIGSAAFPKVQSSRRDHVSPNSLMLIESRSPNAAWTEPRDLTRDEALVDLSSNKVPVCHATEHFFYYDDRLCNAAFYDVHVSDILIPLTKEDAVALLSEEGFDLWLSDEHTGYVPPRRLRWPRITYCSLLLLLTLWPTRYCWPKTQELATSPHASAAEK